MKEGASDPDAAPERAFLPKAVNWRRILKGFVIFFIFTFGTAITNAASTKPPLPTVEVLGTDSAQQSTEGLLVSHSEGFWYVLDQKKDVVAIPDDGVDKVRMH